MNVIYQAFQVKRTKEALAARKRTMQQARLLKNLGIYAYVKVVKQAKEQSAHVRYLKAEYPDLVAIALS